MEHPCGQVLSLEALGRAGEHSPIVSEAKARLRWTCRVEYGYDFHWIGDGSSGALDGEVGLRLPPEFRADLRLEIEGWWRTSAQIEPDGWWRLRRQKARREAPGFGPAVRASLESIEPIPETAGALLATLERVAIGRECVPGEVPAALTALCDAAHRQGKTAVERLYLSELGFLHQAAGLDEALLDCSFCCSPAGQEAHQRSLAGDYLWLADAGAGGALADCVRIHAARFTHGISRQKSVEVHLLPLERCDWRVRRDSLPAWNTQARDEGRVLVYPVQNTGAAEAANLSMAALAVAGGIPVVRGTNGATFSLSHSDRRRLSGANAHRALAPLLKPYGFGEELPPAVDSGVAAAPGGALEACLTLRLPGEAASAWLDAPPERSLAFFYLFTRVSLEIQAAMRCWAPYCYFSDLARYRSPETAWPLLLYQATRPHAGKSRADFTYDVMDPDGVHSAARSAGQRLREILAEVSSLLRGAGDEQTARQYAPRQAPRIQRAVLREPRLLRALLAADTFVVDQLIRLANRSRDVKKDLSSGRRAAPQNLCRFVSRLVHALHGRLRRLYPGHDFTELGTLIVLTATKPLAAFAGRNAEIQAELRLRRLGTLGDEVVFVNRAWQP